METLNEKVLHRDELNRQLASAKAHRDELLVDYIQTQPKCPTTRSGGVCLVAEHVSLIARNNMSADFADGDPVSRFVAASCARPPVTCTP